MRSDNGMNVWWRSVLSEEHARMHSDYRHARLNLRLVRLKRVLLPVILYGILSADRHFVWDCMHTNRMES